MVLGGNEVDRAILGKKNRKQKRAAKVAGPEPDPDAATVPEEHAMSGPQPKFGQALASNNKETRDKAVRALERYLQTARDIEELDLRKIWKALFYCFWQSDKPKIQRDLAERLASLVHAMPDGKAWLFVKVFWGTMTREWTRIDRLRLDKFYMLMRRNLAHALQRLGTSKWEAGEVEAFAAVFGGEGGPINPSCPVGVRYFMADNFVGELREAVRHSSAAGAAASNGSSGSGKASKKKAAAAAAPPTALLSEEALLVLLEPFLVLLGSADDDAMMKRLVDGVVQPMLREKEEEEDDDEDEDGEKEEDDKPPEQRALPRPLSALAERLFDLASGKGTRDRNRKLIYTLQQRIEGMAHAEEATLQQHQQSAVAAATSKAGGKKRKAKAEAEEEDGEDDKVFWQNRPGASAGLSSLVKPEKLAKLKGLIEGKSKKVVAAAAPPVVDESSSAKAARAAEFFGEESPAPKKKKKGPLATAKAEGGGAVGGDAWAAADGLQAKKKKKPRVE